MSPDQSASLRGFRQRAESKDRRYLRRLRGAIMIGLNRFAPVEVCGARVHEAVLAIWK